MCDTPQRGDKILVRNCNGYWVERVFLRIENGRAVCVAIEDEYKYLNGITSYCIIHWQEWKIKPQVYGRPIESVNSHSLNFQKGDMVTDGNMVLRVSKVYLLNGVQYFLGGHFFALTTNELKECKHYLSSLFVELTDK